MADFDPLTIPAVMPATVRRTHEKMVDGKLVSGYPTEAALSQEQASQSWMRDNVVATNIRFNEVSDSIGDVSAAVTNEAIARADADSALAADITTVEASVSNVETGVSNISANGAVYLAAKATPTGATAAYGWYLTAGSAFAGMEAVALSGGGSAIGFTANKFYFTDSGTAQQVFSYSGGSFIFNVPIIIRSATSGERTVITAAKTEVYDSSNTLRVAIGVGI